MKYESVRYRADSGSLICFYYESASVGLPNYSYVALIWGVHEIGFGFRGILTSVVIFFWFTCISAFTWVIDDSSV